tara:strand:- start:10 stop:300 length:291 start_codon:yes stop_codon:yes gene_type:complete
MKNYINNTTKEVFAYESDGSQDDYIQNGLVPINDADLETLRAEEAQAAQDALTYSDKRKAKYDLLNQDEMRYDDVKNSTTTWVDAIDAIKAAHPKP